MHFTRLLSSVLLAVTVAASPIASLSRRLVDSEGQAGAFIVAPENAVFTFVYGSKPDPSQNPVEELLPRPCILRC
jgi:hypothetical protein